MAVWKSRVECRRVLNTAPGRSGEHTDRIRKHRSSTESHVQVFDCLMGEDRGQNIFCLIHRVLKCISCLIPHINFNQQTITCALF